MVCFPFVSGAVCVGNEGKDDLLRRSLKIVILMRFTRKHGNDIRCPSSSSALLSNDLLMIFEDKFNFREVSCMLQMRIVYEEKTLY